MEKRAIVLCGGGAKGAYQIGALKALRKLNFDPDIITGTSVGALNAAFVVMGSVKKAEKLWSKLNMEDVFGFTGKQSDISKVKSMTELTAKLIKSRESASYEPLLKLINKNINERKIRKSNIEYGFVTTQFSPLKKIEIYKEDIPYGQMKNYIMASAACYPYMKSFNINNKSYIDGGYFDNMPIDMVIKRGATDVVVIDLKGVGKINKQIDVPAKITFIRTNYNLGGIMLFNKENSKRNIKLGYLDTLKAFNKLDGNMYTFKKGEAFKTHKIEDKMLELYRKLFSELPTSSTIEKLAQKNIKNCLNDYRNNLFKFNSNTLTSLELAANIFNIDYLKVYSFTGLSNKVVVESNRFNRENEEVDFDIKNLLKKVLKVEKLNDIFKLYDKRKVVLFLKRVMSKELILSSDKKDINMLAIAFPDTVLAAMFLKIYEENNILFRN